MTAAALSGLSSSTSSTASSTAPSASNTTAPAQLGHTILCSACNQAIASRSIPCTCTAIQYCTLQCRINHWAIHQKACLLFGKGTPLKDKHEEIEKLLTWGHENYKAVLDLVQATKQDNYKLFWLRQMAERGHVPLMIAYFNELVQRLKTDLTAVEKLVHTSFDDLVKEAISWSHRIVHCTYADTSCVAHRAFLRLPDMLQSECLDTLEPLLIAHKKMDLYRTVSREDAVRTWSPLLTHPSPVYLFSYIAKDPLVAAGIARSFGPFSQETCLKVRLEAKEKMIQSLSCIHEEKKS